MPLEGLFELATVIDDVQTIFDSDDSSSEPSDEQDGKSVLSTVL